MEVMVAAQSGTFFRTALQCSSVVLALHGHKKKHAPQSLHGELIHGHLKAAKKGARNTDLLCAAQQINCGWTAHRAGA
jgi:hypothetical protein